MRVLGIEGTAHTCGVGIVEDDPGRPDRCRVLANRAHMYRPESGGIHPREAAEHHVEHLPGLLADALDEANVAWDDIDGIAFSQAPGLGPCLRTVATFARALALRHEKPLSGINHCVAHLEIGRAVDQETSMDGPTPDGVLLYASGGNTQVIAEARGRYRVFGETLDIGIGNALDKFARDQDIPFPGGPEIERMAEQGKQMLEESGEPLPELPYGVKGMDVAFSGLVNAANALVANGTPLPIVCHAFQEWAYAMLVEVTERALAHAEKEAVILGGGVGRNQRLQAMLRSMTEARGATFHVPEPPLLSDNGAMIAWNGLLKLRAGHPTAIGESMVDQTQRTDDVDLLWRTDLGSIGQRRPIADDGTLARGAEASIELARFLDREVIVKRRHPKAYRHGRIEQELVSARVRREVRGLIAAKTAGVRVPDVVDADPTEGVIVQSIAPGVTLKEALLATERSDAGTATPGLADPDPTMRELGRQVALLHDAGHVHGDLTTSNVIVDDSGVPTLVDLGLAERTDEDEPRAVDIHVLQEALASTHADHEPLWEAFVASYRTHAGSRTAEVMRRYDDLVQRGRYRIMTG